MRPPVLQQGGSKDSFGQVDQSEVKAVTVVSTGSCELLNFKLL